MNRKGFGRNQSCPCWDKSGGSKEYHHNSGWPVFRPRFEQGTIRKPKPPQLFPFIQLYH